jgi:hypothetical protein
MFAQRLENCSTSSTIQFPKGTAGAPYINHFVLHTTMPALLALARTPQGAPEIQGAPEHTESEHTEVSMEIPGRSVHPAKLIAMLRSNFGFGAYDIMV